MLIHIWWRGWRLAAFISGVLSLWVATASRLAPLDHEMLTAHMVQHLLLDDRSGPVNPAREAPVIVLLQSLPQGFRSSGLLSSFCDARQYILRFAGSPPRRP